MSTHNKVVLRSKKTGEYYSDRTYNFTGGIETATRFRAGDPDIAVIRYMYSNVESVDAPEPPAPGPPLESTPIAVCRRHPEMGVPSPTKTSKGRINYAGWCIAVDFVAALEQGKTPDTVEYVVQSRKTQLLKDVRDARRDPTDVLSRIAAAAHAITRRVLSARPGYKELLEA